MMKVLKIILSVFILFLCTSFIFKGNHLPTSRGGYEVEVFLPWTRSGSGYWTQYKGYSVYNDFDYMITKSKYPINGGYYYDFWFYSQSYYWDGYTAQYTSTNVRNFILSDYNGNIITQDKSNLGITFKDAFNAVTLRYTSTSPSLGVKFTWSSMSAK